MPLWKTLATNKRKGLTSYSQHERHYVEGLFNLHADQAAKYRTCLPNCFIIGAAKCGTTTLAEALGKHRGAFLSKKKEPKFFGTEYARGWDWYGKLFARAEGQRIRIDASTRYTSSDAMFLGTAHLISNYIENPRFIYIVRHPLDRIVSHWRHAEGMQSKRSSPFNSILTDKKLNSMLVGASMYYDRISIYRKYFSDDSILCLTFEDMLSDPRILLKRVLDFLDLRSSDRLFDRLLPGGAFLQRNPAGARGRKLVPKPEWNPSIREEVIRILSPDSRRFLEYAGKPVNFWADL